MTRGGLLSLSDNQRGVSPQPHLDHRILRAGCQAYSLLGASHPGIAAIVSDGRPFYGQPSPEGRCGFFQGGGRFHFSVLPRSPTPQRSGLPGSGRTRLRGTLEARPQTAIVSHTSLAGGELSPPNHIYIIAHWTRIAS